MASTPKILGQANPGAAVLTTIYTVPSATNVIVSTIFVANRSSVSTSFRIAIAISGAADSSEQYLYYNQGIPGEDTFTATVGVTLSANDRIRVYSTLATLSFNVVGTEIT